MTISPTPPATADDALAEIEAALADIRRAQDADDPAAAADGYERRAAAWTALYESDARDDVLAQASPAVLRSLLRSAIPGAAFDARHGAVEYRQLSNRQQQGASGAPAA